MELDWEDISLWEIVEKLKYSKKHTKNRQNEYKWRKKKNER